MDAHGSLAQEALVSQDKIAALHALLSDGFMPDHAMCGRIRRRTVEIGGSVYLPAALPQRLEELFGIVVGMAGEIDDPFEQAFFLMVHLPYLQPFEDVNKHVSRLAANIPFIRQNLCSLSFRRAEDRNHLVQLVLKELDGLHAGNAVRFGLRPFELLSWKQMQL